jgi:hypothetical protein
MKLLQVLSCSFFVHFSHPYLLYPSVGAAFDARATKDHSTHLWLPDRPKSANSQHHVLGTRYFLGIYWYKSIFIRATSLNRLGLYSSKRSGTLPSHAAPERPCVIHSVS